MCGIAGIALRDADRSAETLEAEAFAMADTLRHRGPDDRGAWADAAAGIALAHRRLSIVDLSAAGHQPMHSACGRWVLSYNGEVYGFAALRTELESVGVRFRGTSDTEVLLEAVAFHGLEKTLPRLNGMFAFALWDRHERRLTLVRDRAGKKPLYYGWCGNVFLFASELKALAAHSSFAGEVDRDSLGGLMQFGWVPSPGSIFRGIHKLPAASLLALEPSRGPGAMPAPKPYWSALEAAKRGESEPFRGSLSEAADALEERLLEATRERLVADVEVGALLSGGIDSAAVVAMMRRASSAPIRSFCIGFDEKRYDESEHARATARHFGTEHVEMTVAASDALEWIPKLPELWDEPFADPSAIPTAIVSQLARQHITVAISGDGGDELFLGYGRYRRALAAFERAARLPVPLRSAIAGSMRAASRAGWNLLGPSRSSETRLPKWRRFPAKLERRALIFDAKSAADLHAREAERIAPASRAVPGARPIATSYTDDAAWAELHEPLQAMMWQDFLGFLGDGVLVKVDRASMASSLEVRSPLLDTRVVEFAWSLPMELRMDALAGKRVLRELLSRHLPRELFERPKQGFTLPIEDWLRGPLAEWAGDLLSPERLRRRGMLDPATLEVAFRQHRSGWRTWTGLLWAALVFEAWHEARQAPR